MIKVHHSVGITVRDTKVFFSIIVSHGEIPRNEEFAKQQQSIAGYKPKFHGFADFGVVQMNASKDVLSNLREVGWWCYKEKQNEQVLLDLREIEDAKAKKRYDEHMKFLTDEENKKEKEFENLKKGKQQLDQDVKRNKIIKEFSSVM